MLVRIILMDEDGVFLNLMWDISHFACSRGWFSLWQSRPCRESHTHTVIDHVLLLLFLLFLLATCLWCCWRQIEDVPSFCQGASVWVEATLRKCWRFPCRCLSSMVGIQMWGVFARMQSSPSKSFNVSFQKRENTNAICAHMLLSAVLTWTSTWLSIPWSWWVQTLRTLSALSLPKAVMERSTLITTGEDPGESQAQRLRRQLPFLPLSLGKPKEQTQSGLLLRENLAGAFGLPAFNLSSGPEWGWWGFCRQMW